MAHKTNFLSLSTSLQTRLIESNWLVASRFPAQDSPMPSEDKKRWSMTYHTHNAISGVVRTVLDLIICTTVAPVGLLWHTSWALFYSRKSQDLSSRHWDCAGAELVKVLVLVSIVSMPFLLKVSKTSPYLQQLAGVSIPLIGIIVGAEIGTTLFTPAYNSRYLNGLHNDGEWVAKMALKWELGIQASEDPSRRLNHSIESFAKEILYKISSIQQNLPPKHRLPFDPKVDNHKILRYLEESREDLMHEGKWEEIKPLRDEIAYYGNILNRLLRYKKYTGEFPINEQLVTNAYQGNFPARHGALELVNTRPPRELHIYSLTQILFKKMLESNWLYPSNYESREIPDKGSIAESMLEINPYENRRKITSSFHTYLKPVRYLARSLGNVGALCIGIPGGTLYNGVQSLRYVALAKVMGSSESFGNWQKANAYAWAAFNDFTTLFTGYGLPFFNETMLFTIATRADRSGLFKSTTLKNSFGITGPQGKLLSYHYGVDVPEREDYDDYFLDLQEQRSLALWNKLNRVYNRLTHDSQGQMDSLFKEFNSRGKFSQLITLFQKNGISQKTQDECCQMFEDLVELRHLIEGAFTTTESSLFDKRRYHISNDFTYFAYDFYGFESEENLNTLWMQILGSAQADIGSYNIQQANISPVYQEFKDRVLDSEATPQSILGLEQLTQFNLNQAYKKFALHLHPDKVEGDENLKDEAKKLFQLLQKAKAILDDKLAE